MYMLMDYLPYAAIVAALIVAVAIALRLGYSKQVARLAYTLVCKAEQEITGTKQGQARKAAVVRWLYDWLPPLAKLLLTYEDIDRLIEAAVDRLHKTLAAAAEEA